MDRDQQRKNKRNTVSGFSCTSGAELTPLKSPTGRPGVACDPTPAAPLPLSPSTPAPCPPLLPVPLNLPPGLIINNDPAVAFCPSTGGYSVTGTTATSVAAGTQQQVVIFTALENITENQLNYLFEVMPSSSAAIVAAALSGATSTVINLTHLNYAQSEELIITIQDAKFTVNTLAVEQARNLLICQVENDLQFATCPTSAYFGPSAAVPAGLLYTPTATAATGSVLVNFALTPTSGNQTAFTLINIPSLTAAAAQANSLAFSQADSLLRCVFGNAATAAACCATGSPGNNLGFTYCVPTTGPTIEGSATAVGYFSVSANTVFSAVSATEANSVARELSRESLNCYFPSTGVTATCVGLGLTAPFAPDATTAAYLPPGSVILYDTDASVTAANAQASAIAFASLNCFWSNAEITAFCPPSGTFTAINNSVYNLAASASASLNYSSTILANTVISYTSYADANTQALGLASANVSCIYCNAVVAPTCIGGINGTIGATANLICSVLANVAQNTAISVGNILVSSSEGGINCCYGSDAVNNTINCGGEAYRNAGSNFTSVDSFFLPANIITVCEDTPAPPPPPVLFSYERLFATNVAQVGCCSDILLCGGLTGSVTALPPLWSYTSNLFDAYPYGATFYTNSSGETPYAFPAGFGYVVSRDVTPRAYRTVTGGTGYTNSLTSCISCSLDTTAYTLKGSTAVNYSSTAAAMVDMFCGGPTAQNVTLYTSTDNILSSTSTWYTDVCGLSAFTPVTVASPTGRYFIGYRAGSTGYLLAFASTGSNAANVVASYNTTSCPVSVYPYAVYLGSICATGVGATTLYGSLPAPQLFTSPTGSSATFYTSQFNDAAIYSVGATSYINYLAADATVYSRSIYGNTAAPPFTCTTVYKTTVQWSNVSAAEVCDYPNFYSPTADGIFNTNIRTLWCDVENPFVSSATAKFFTSPVGISGSEFKPGVSGPVYLSKFTPGDKYRSSYRQYSWSNVNSTLKSYTAAFKESPFIQTQGFTGTNIWLHSATADLMGVSNVGSRPRTKEFLNMPASNTCAQSPVYSDIKFALTTPAALFATYKRLPFPPAVAQGLYSNNLLFDGIGYQLSSSVNGTTGANTITLNDLTKVGAGFAGAIISTNATGISDIGIRPYPTYIAGINETSGVVTLGGYYNSVNAGFTGRPVHVTGFKIDATGWTGGGGSPNFQCSGPHCNKLEVGHSLFSYKIVSPGGGFISSGFVTRVIGSTVYYSSSPGFDNFLATFDGTGASDGSGHVYVQGRQFARFWLGDNKQNPVLSNLYSNNHNYIWKQGNPATAYTTAKNLVLGNTAGSTAEFIVAGVNYAGLLDYVPRPYSYTGPVEWNAGMNAYLEPTWTYSCTGAVSSGLIPRFNRAIGYINSCCDLITAANTAEYGNTAVSACKYYETYLPYALYGEVPAPAYHGFLQYLPFNNTYYYNATTTPVNGDYVVDKNTSDPGNGRFENTMFAAGQVELSYPCSANQLWNEQPNTIWMRKYIGYFNDDPIYPEYPTDATYPGGWLLNDASYWSGPGKSNTGAGASGGYVFKEYEPATGAETGCNCGNFIHEEYSPTSGVRYSIWPSINAGWNSCYAGSLYMPEMISVTAANQPVLDFNECATACNPIYTCAGPSDCDIGAPGAFAAPLIDTEVIAFNSSSYGIPTLFDFSENPIVGGTAETLKAEATEIAQNLVNSFVSCYYFNDFQLGETCAAETEILFRLGSVAAGEVISQISKADANVRAKDIANSRTICVDENIIPNPGGGCSGTSITNAVLADEFFTIDLKFEQDLCAFATTLEIDQRLTMQTVTLVAMTVCASNGENKTIYVPDFGSGGSKNMVLKL